jgi:predicted porin
MPALAQVPPEIQIYGRVNVSFERITIDNSTDPTVPNQSNYELVDNSSRIGIRGNKELTRGLKAIFQIESRTKLDDSAGSFLSSRDSFAGLQGGFGTMRAGAPSARCTTRPTTTSACTTTIPAPPRTLCSLARWWAIRDS